MKRGENRELELRRPAARLPGSVRVVVAAAVLVVAACGGDGRGYYGDDDDDSFGGGGDDGSCGWHGNCSGRAPEGAYDCAGDTMYQCIDGSWEHVVSCPLTENSRGYSCTCKGGCGVDATECSYAFDVCEGHRYSTCGPDYHPEIHDRWECVPGGDGGPDGGGGDGGGGGGGGGEADCSECVEICIRDGYAGFGGECTAETCYCRDCSACTDVCLDAGYTGFSGECTAETCYCRDCSACEQLCIDDGYSGFNGLCTDTTCYCE